MGIPPQLRAPTQAEAALRTPLAAPVRYSSIARPGLCAIVEYHEEIAGSWLLSLPVSKSTDLTDLFNNRTAKSAAKLIEFGGAASQALNKIADGLAARLSQESKLLEAGTVTDADFPARLDGIRKEMKSSMLGLKVSGTSYRVIPDSLPAFHEAVKSGTGSSLVGTIYEQAAENPLNSQSKTLLMRKALSVEIDAATRINAKTVVAGEQLMAGFKSIAAVLAFVPIATGIADCFRGTGATQAASCRALGAQSLALVPSYLAGEALAAGGAALCVVLVPVVGGGFAVVIAGLATVAAIHVVTGGIAELSRQITYVF